MAAESSTQFLAELHEHREHAAEPLPRQDGATDNENAFTGGVFLADGSTAAIRNSELDGKSVIVNTPLGQAFGADAALCACGNVALSLQNSLIEGNSVTVKALSSDANGPSGGAMEADANAKVSNVRMAGNAIAVNSPNQTRPRSARSACSSAARSRRRSPTARSPATPRGRTRRTGRPPCRAPGSPIPGCERTALQSGSIFRSGTDWWPYVMRRIGENPRNLLLLTRSLVPWARPRSSHTDPS
jgi:hypothetical protein